MDPSYIRPLPTRQSLRIVRCQEAGCFIWCLSVIFVPRVLVGIWPIPFVIHAYLTGVMIVLLNSIRTLGSHRWTNAGDPMNFVQQLLDSVNYPKFSWASELWGPVGTRYHALHHLFPSMPYHRLPAAHARLMRELPADSLYRQTCAPSLTAAILDLWRRTQSVRHAAPNAVDYFLSVRKSS
jgi:fatty acid desaturase